MKKSILSLFLVSGILFGTAQVFANGKSDTEEVIEDSAKSVKRSSVKTPSLSLENHTLYFNTSCDGCTLQLLDESGNVKYTKVIPENTSNITLPSDMAGGCELQIIRGQYCFYGLIDL